MRAATNEPLGIEAVEQLMVLPSPQEVGGAVAPFRKKKPTNVSPVGNVSVICTFAAVSGPLFVYVIVYVRSVSGAAVAGPVLVTARSVRGLSTVVLAAELSFELFGSEVLDVTDAVLLTTTPSEMPESRWTTTRAATNDPL